MTVRRLLAETDALELAEWIAFEQIEGPLGGGRDDYHAGLIAATVVNTQLGKGATPVKVSDFMPEWDQGAPRPVQSDDEMEAIARAMNKAFGGTEVGS